MYKKFRDFVALREDATNATMNLKMPATPQQKADVNAKLDLLKTAPPMPGVNQGKSVNTITTAKKLNNVIPAIKNPGMAISLARAQSDEMQ